MLVNVLVYSQHQLLQGSGFMQWFPLYYGETHVIKSGSAQQELLDVVT